MDTLFTHPAYNQGFRKATAPKHPMPLDPVSQETETQPPLPSLFHAHTPVCDRFDGNHRGSERLRQSQIRARYTRESNESKEANVGSPAGGLPPKNRTKCTRKSNESDEAKEGSPARGLPSQNRRRCTRESKEANEGSPALGLPPPTPPACPAAACPERSPWTLPSPAGRGWEPSGDCGLHRPARIVVFGTAVLIMLHDCVSCCLAGLSRTSRRLRGCVLTGGL